MAGNGIQVDSSGRIKVKSNGIVVAGAGDPCCCASPCTECTSLGSPTSGSMSATISGVTICSGCTSLSPGTGFFKTLFNPNGTFTFPQVSGSPCFWRRSATEASAILRTYTSGTCAVSNGSGVSYQMNLSLSSGVWTFCMFATDVVVSGTVPHWFYGTATAVNCTSPFTINNVYASCGSTAGSNYCSLPGVMIATGGQIDITP